MRILILKFCSNIRFGNAKETNGGNTEIEVFLDLIKDHYKITVLTIERYHKNKPEFVSCIDWDNLNLETINNDYDLVFAFNGVLNCYGGVVSKESLISYKIFNKATIPVIYGVTDTNIPIGNLSGWIVNNHSKNKYLELNPNDYVIDASKISCITQTYDLKCLKKIWKSPENQFKKYIHFPFEQTVLYREQLVGTINYNPNNRLIYFGNSRGGKRDKKFVEYYCNNKFETIVYGNWDADKIKQKYKIEGNIDFKGKLDMYLLHQEINNSLAHLYISDPVNEGTIWTTRFYEAILNRTLLFIDIKNDPDKKIFNHDFFYIKNNQDLHSKMVAISQDLVFRAQLIKYQYDIILSRFDHQIYKNLLLESLKECLL